MSKKRKTTQDRVRAQRETRPVESEVSAEPDWTRACENCGQKPVVPITGMCGPCTWGEADTMGGNW